LEDDNATTGRASRARQQYVKRRISRGLQSFEKWKLWIGDATKLHSRATEPAGADRAFDHLADGQNVLLIEDAGEDDIPDYLACSERRMGSTRKEHFALWLHLNRTYLRDMKNPSTIIASTHASKKTRRHASELPSAFFI
jgi:hypothetical protein